MEVHRGRAGRWRCRDRHQGEARARGRLVPVRDDAAAGAADDPERHQPAALRDAEGHHGGEEERDRQGGGAGRPVVAPEDRGALRAAEGQADGDDQRLARRSRQGTGASGCAKRRGSCDSRHRRTERRQAQSRELGDDRGRAAAVGWRCRSRSPCRPVGGRRSPASWRRPRWRKSSPSITRRSLTTRRMRSCRRCSRWSRRQSPPLVVLPHTYQTRDFSPTLATRLDRALVTDVIALRKANGAADVRAPDVPGQADRRREAAGTGAALRRRSRSARSAPMPAEGERRRAGHHRRHHDRRVEAAPEGRGAVPGSQAGGRSLAGRADRLRRPRHQVAGEHRGGGAAGQGVRRRAGGVASDLRQRLAADGAPDWQLRPDRGAEALRRRSASPAPFSTWSA